MDFDKELEVAKKIALQAGEIMLEYFDGDQKVQTKSDNSPVTVADTLVNQMVITELEKEFPKDGIIGEEQSTSEYGMGRKWICDPIDGTEGYVWGVPTSMFSLALVLDGRSMLGVAYDPFLKKLYWGIVGKGSYCNDRRLHVSNGGLKGGYVAITSTVPKIRELPYIPSLDKEGVRVASVSGAVYKSCLVARGRFVGYIQEGVNAHDMAAVQVIVEEAGGKVTMMNGEECDYSKPFRGTIVSNGLVHARLVEIVK